MPVLAAIDVVVGVAFLAAAAFAVGPAAERALIGAVGAAWLLVSLVDTALLVHQGVLAVALLAFPSGRPRGTLRWALVAVAVVVALGWIPQLGVVVLFAATAAVSLAHWYPAVAAGLVGAVLAWVWSATEFTWRSWSPDDGLLAYDTVLLLVAAGFVVATRIAAVHRARLADRLLTDEGLDGLDGLARVLAQTLDDPDLRVLRWDATSGAYLDSLGLPPSTDPSTRLLQVGDPNSTAVESRSIALADGPTAAGVVTAVQLVVSNTRLQAALSTQLGELEAARRRIVAATDRQREMIAARLRNDVIALVESAVDDLRRAPIDRANASEVIDIAVQELAGAADEIDALVAGVPREPLGGGRLVEAIRELARRSPGHATVTVSGVPAADPETETTLLHVVSEALTNAAKHAHSRTVEIAIRDGDGTITVEVRDDGRGGADASGSGLQGLADRLAARGGQLRVDSRSAAGTTVFASVPR